MTESARLEAAEIQARLPSGWVVEDDGDEAVYGYAEGYALPELPCPANVPASFELCRVGDLWSVTWREPSELRNGHHGPSGRITGTRERCVEWVVEQAATLEELFGD